MSPPLIDYPHVLVGREVEWWKRRHLAVPRFPTDNWSVDMAKPTCFFPDCDRPVWAKDLCGGHYQQRKSGKPLTMLRPRLTFSTPEERFWHYTNKGPGCWVWVGAIQSAGYGLLSLGSRNHRVLAHRFSYELRNGPIPAGLEVRHQCHNPACVNPNHLLVGTHRENFQDSVRDKRIRHGSTHPYAKLTEDQARAIYADNRLYREIAVDYGVSRQTIAAIKNGVSWKHVNGSEV